MQNFGITISVVKHFSAVFEKKPYQTNGSFWDFFQQFNSAMENASASSELKHQSDVLLSKAAVTTSELIDFVVGQLQILANCR